MSNSTTNLDSLCAEYGYIIVKDCSPDGSIPKSDKSKLEGTITKSLGVLQENGVYAFYLYLDYRKEEKGAKQVTKRSLELLKKLDFAITEVDEIPYPQLRKLTENIDILLFARQLLDQMLIYARYHAKALNAKTGESE